MEESVWLVVVVVVVVVVIIGLSGAISIVGGQRPSTKWTTQLSRISKVMISI